MHHQFCHEERNRTSAETRARRRLRQVPTPLRRAHGTVRHGLVIAVSALLSACNGVDKLHWQEQVLLHDGRVVSVEREVRARHWGFPNSNRGPALDYDLYYKPLNVRWHGLAAQEPRSFEIFDGVPYLAIYEGGRSFCEHREKGRFRARFMKWDGGAWNEVSQSDYPTDKALMNLYVSYRGVTAESDAKGFVSWREKAIVDFFDPEKPYTVSAWYKEFHGICKG